MNVYSHKYFKFIRPIIICLLFYYFSSCVVAGEIDARNEALYYEKTSSLMAIVKNLDMTSFPSSIGPQRKHDKYTLFDYGFNIMSLSNNNIILIDHNDGWTFQINLIDHDNEDHTIICLYDSAGSEGTYHTGGPLLLSLKSDGYLKGMYLPPRKDCH